MRLFCLYLPPERLRSGWCLLQNPKILTLLFFVPEGSFLAWMVLFGNHKDLKTQIYNFWPRASPSGLRSYFFLSLWYPQFMSFPIASCHIASFPIKSFHIVSFMSFLVISDHVISSHLAKFNLNIQKKKRSLIFRYVKRFWKTTSILLANHSCPSVLLRIFN